MGRKLIMLSDVLTPRASFSIEIDLRELKCAERGIEGARRMNLDYLASE